MAGSKLLKALKRSSKPTHETLGIGAPFGSAGDRTSTSTYATATTYSTTASSNLTRSSTRSNMNDTYYTLEQTGGYNSWTAL